MVQFIELHNKADAKPFKWRANPDEIIAARNRGFQLLESIHYERGDDPDETTTPEPQPGLQG